MDLIEFTEKHPGLWYIGMPCLGTALGVMCPPLGHIIVACAMAAFGVAALVGILAIILR